MSNESKSNYKKLKAGELLFREGEPSGSMYLITKGLIRIFKKKGEQQIEIDSLRPGQILGELSFLDQEPRSASAEAIIDTEIVEINQSIYQNTFVNIPEWVKVLLKAVSSRLRATTVKLKNLEHASSEFAYTDEGSKRNYIFISSHDSLKIAMATLLVSTRTPSDRQHEKKLRILSLERYATQILGIPLSKVMTFLEGLKKAEIVRIEEDSNEIYMLRETELDNYIQFICEENLLAPDKRHDISHKAFMIMDSIYRNLYLFPKNATTQLTQVNLVEVQRNEMVKNGKNPFRMDEFEELVKNGFASTLIVNSAQDQSTLIQEENFTKAYQIQKIIYHLSELNEEKNQLGRIA